MLHSYALSTPGRRGRDCALELGAGKCRMMGGWGKGSERGRAARHAARAGARDRRACSLKRVLQCGGACVRAGG